MRQIGMAAPAHSPPSSIQVRLATLRDLEVITAFNQAMAQETEGKRIPEVTAREGVRAALSDPARASYYLADLDGLVAGQTMITTEWSDWRNGFFWWIQSVYVSPEFRRRGVFRALHAFIREQARRTRGVCGIRLYVHHDNHPAMTTYRHLGMSRTDYLLLEEDWSALQQPS